MAKKILIVAFLLPLLTTMPAAAAAKDKPAAPQETAAAQQPGDALSSVSPQLIDRIVTLFNKGVSLMDRYQPVEAATAFREVVKLAPDWTTGRLNLGIALLNTQREGDYGRSEAELKKVIATDPSNPYAHYALGMLLKHLTRFDEATAQFQRVVEIDPDDADAHYQLGVLLVNSDPAKARAHIEKTLEIAPHHESACYRLQALLRKAGETERAKELLLRFQALKNSGAGTFAGMKYGEMGRYAEVIRAFAEAAPAAEPHGPPAYTDTAKKAGLQGHATGTPGWPGEDTGNGSPAFAPGVAVADVDGDGDLDLYMTGIGKKGAGALYRNDAGHFSPADRTGIDGRNAVGAYFGDYDGDGDPDLYLTRAGTNRLYRNEGGNKFADVTEATGTGGGDTLSVGAAWADADHDGDLDLYVANFSARNSKGTQTSAVANSLWRNNGNGTFTDVAQEAGIDGGPAATMSVAFFDADGDRDLDLYLVNYRSPNRLFLNDRVGRYTDATSRFPLLADDGPGLGAVLGDVDQDGREDLLLLRGPEAPRLFLHVERATFVEDHAFAATARKLGGAVGGLVGDLDLDGNLDIVLLDAGTHGKFKDRVLMNLGAGTFAEPVAFGKEDRAPAARGALAVDLDGNGSLELLVARADAPPQLWSAPVPRNRGWLTVIPGTTGSEDVHWADPAAVGVSVEVKTGRRLQIATINSSTGYLGGLPRRVHFGLGTGAKADYVRLVWPDAVLQSELEVAADQNWRMTKIVRKPSSCPLLFAWNGERFAFVTDFMGVGGVGFFSSPGVYGPPDPTEDIRVPPALVAPRRDRYLLRLAEPLEEITYFDELRLDVYDHPGNWEVYPDERFAVTPPLPTARPLAVADKIFPVSARDDSGRNVLDRLRAIDRRYVEPPLDRRFVGYARNHWIELDFGEQLHRIDPGAPLILYLYSWVEYTYSHVNYAAYQAGLRMQAPSIEVPDGRGGWRVAMPEVGYPAGLPRMMTVDISSLPLRRDGRLRLRTNMEIYWDQIFAAPDVGKQQLRTHTLAPVVANLRPLGFPREYSPDGRLPTIYDYHRVDHGVPFKNMAGDFTRFGDVRPLLASTDDRFVIMGRGDEIAVEFDAAALPKLPAGWSRTLVLHTDGYTKDMDLYTAFPDTVAPLPYHGMENYPPSKPPAFDDDWKAYHRKYNTRRIAGR